MFPLSEKGYRPQVQITKDRTTLAVSTEIERYWWGPETKFITRAEASLATVMGQMNVVPKEGRGWRTIGRINDTREGEPTLLRPVAVAVLEEIGNRWKDRTGEEDPNLLSVTSLYRDLELQNRLHPDDALEGDNSSHLAGVAIDLSLRSYYRVQGEERIPVMSWNDPEGRYDPKYAAMLLDTVSELVAEGWCNAVIEYRMIEGRNIPSVLHVCANPDLDV